MPKQEQQFMNRKQAAKFLSELLGKPVSPVTIRHHTYYSSTKLLQYVIVKTGEDDKGHRPAQVMYTPEGLRWFASVLPELGPGPRPENFVEDLLKRNPPPKIKNPFEK